MKNIDNNALFKQSQKDMEVLNKKNTKTQRVSLNNVGNLLYLNLIRGLIPKLN
jgi:hypothetical protein